MPSSKRQSKRKSGKRGAEPRESTGTGSSAQPEIGALRTAQPELDLNLNLNNVASQTETPTDSSIASHPLDNPDKPLNVNSIISAFPTNFDWRWYHAKTLEDNTTNYEATSARIKWAEELIDEKAPIMLERQAIFSQLAGVPESRYIEWSQWDTYLDNLSRALPAMHHHLNWLTMHSACHESMQPAFLDFWEIREEMEEIGQQPTNEQNEEWDEAMKGILAFLEGENKKRVFLVKKLLDCVEWEGPAWADPPVWTEWD